MCRVMQISITLPPPQSRDKEIDPSKTNIWCEKPLGLIYLGVLEKLLKGRKRESKGFISGFTLLTSFFSTVLTNRTQVCLNFLLYSYYIFKIPPIFSCIIGHFSPISTYISTHMHILHPHNQGIGFMSSFTFSCGIDAVKFTVLIMTPKEGSSVSGPMSHLPQRYPCIWTLSSVCSDVPGPEWGCSWKNIGKSSE